MCKWRLFHMKQQVDGVLLPLRKLPAIGLEPATICIRLWCFTDRAVWALKSPRTVRYKIPRQVVTWLERKVKVHFTHLHTPRYVINNTLSHIASHCRFHMVTNCSPWVHYANGPGGPGAHVRIFVEIFFLVFLSYFPLFSFFLSFYFCPSSNFVFSFLRSVSFFRSFFPSFFALFSYLSILLSFFIGIIFACMVWRGLGSNKQPPGLVAPSTTELWVSLCKNSQCTRDKRPFLKFKLYLPYNHWKTSYINL